MGYTHYWKMTDKLMNEEVLGDVQKVFEEYQDIIQVEFNESGKPIVDKDMIKFNGRGDEGHETFYLAPVGQSGFCKTNGKPYDLAVCETLLVLKHHYGNDFELESDGFYVGQEGLERDALGGNWNEAIDNVKERYGYEFDLIPKTERSGGFEYHSFDVLSSDEYQEKLMEDKKALLLVEKSIDLNFGIVAEQEDEKGDLHVLCRRESDHSYVVWTSYNTGEVENSYVDLYNGKYDMSREEGFKELDRRSGKNKEMLKGVYTYSGFDEPKKIANDLSEFVENGRIESNYHGDITDDVLFHIDELQDWHKDNVVISDEEFEKDMKDLLCEYDVFLNPTRDELEEVNERYGLPKETYIEDAFSDNDELTKKLNKAMSMDKGLER